MNTIQNIQDQDSAEDIPPEFEVPEEEQTPTTVALTDSPVPNYFSFGTSYTKV